jgi:hypothetical protein
MFRQRSERGLSGLVRRVCGRTNGYRRALASPNPLGYSAAMPGPPRIFRAFLIAAVIATAGGCATVGPAPPNVVVRDHSPREFMADSGSVGRFRVANACIYFDRAQQPLGQVPALFPRGSRLSGDRRSIILPDGQAVPFGEQVNVTAERPPFGQRDETCGPSPIEVLSVRPAQL